jgi:multidrug efflux pump subunit AcrA (membrane-fusion protein)
MTVSLAKGGRARLGIASEPAAAAQYTPSDRAFGSVLDPQALLQRLSDLQIARAALVASGHAARRTASLLQDDGAASRQETEVARSQATQDEARKALLEQQIRNEWGVAVLALENDASEFAAGTVHLVRIDLDVGQHLDRGPTTAALQVPGLDTSFPLEPVWPAPAVNAARPGESYLALARNSPRLRSGMRGIVELPSGKAVQTGVIVPAEALVYNEGAAWLFVDEGEGRFRRVLVPTDRPTARGYFVDQAIRPGDLLVTSGSALLLAEELGSEDSED